MLTTSIASPRRRATPPATAGADDRTPLAQSLGRRVEALAGHLQAALDGDERAIHQARVATRRLREIVPIVTDTQSGRGERLRRRLKRLTAALGPVRELDVALTLVNGRAKETASPAVVALRAHLTERRRAAFEHLREACDPGRARRLLSRLADLVRDRDLASSARPRRPAEPRAPAPGPGRHRSRPRSRDRGGRCRRHPHHRSRARGPHRRQAAALRARVDRRAAAGADGVARVQPAGDAGRAGRIARPRRAAHRSGAGAQRRAAGLHRGQGSRTS